MKKITCLLLAIGMVLTLGACESGSDKVPQDDVSNESPAQGASTDSQWPTSAINLVVPASAGGGTDSNARVVAKYLTGELGVPVNVVNIGGASGVTGCTEVLEADPDGYTMLYFDDNIPSNYALGTADFNWDDFAPCGRIYEIPFYLVSSPAFSTVEEMKSAAQTPNTVIFAGESGGFIGMLPYAMNQKLGISLKIVDGGQMAERLPLIISDQVQLTFAPMSQVADYYETGDLNLLCTFGPERVAEFEEIPTAAECGMDINYQRFQGILAPKDTDPAIIEKMSNALKAISEDADFQKDSSALSVYVSYGTAEEFSEQFAEFDAAVTEYVSYIG